MWTKMKATIRARWRDWLDGLLALGCMLLLLWFVYWVFGRNL